MLAEPHPQFFRPRARLMLLLGDQLIRDAGIAVVELVKNAYDADATHCSVTLERIEAAEPGDARIVLEDNGHGMDLDRVLNVWLEPGTEYRKQQRMRGERSAKFKRAPLGEKGVGRFAVHKLGRRVRLITRRSRRDEVVVEIDWREFDGDRYLSDVAVDVRERKPEVFRGRRSGTRIEVSDLRDAPWSRSRIQLAQRAILSICSPFSGPDRFAPTLTLDPPSEVLDGLSTAEQVLEESLFRFRGRIVGKKLTYDYEFCPIGELDGVARRAAKRRKMSLTATTRDARSGKTEHQPLDLAAHAIGPIEIDLHIFHRDPVVLRLTSADPPGLRDYLDRNGGVRAYRDGVRIYDFGEPGNDWLGLGSRRLTMPARRVSNHQVLGAVHLERDASTDLIEKTNREGFVENDASEAFRQAILFALSQAEAERDVDKARIRNYYARGKSRQPVVEELAELRLALERAGVARELEGQVKRLETQYRTALEQLLTAAGTGLNLASVLHELERGLKELDAAIGRGEGRDELAAASGELTATVESLTWLTRSVGRTEISASNLVRQTLTNSSFRFRAHRVEAVDGMALGDPDFRVRCSRRLIVASLMNLIDNSIYWLENRGAKRKRIYVGTTYEVHGLPALIVADDGPGFADPPETVAQPFFTRKPSGTGLGLHIASEIMHSHGGSVLFPRYDEITLPKPFRGAVVGLEFPE